MAEKTMFKQQVLAPLAISLVTLLAILALLGYLVFLRPASVESVCENFFLVYELELEETLGTDLTREQVEENIDLNQAECEEEEAKTRRESEVGILEEVKVSKCQANAEDFDAFIDCIPEN